MGLYLTIPDIVESEPLVSLVAAHDGVTFIMVMNVGDTAVRLMRANQDGEHIPLVVLTTDAQILALDSVFVTQFSLAAQSAVAELSVQATEVRFV